MTSDPAPVGRWLSGYAIAAAVLAVSGVHVHQSSDSLIFTLLSRHHWTAFYWEQDRVGMLVPLMAMPVRHPLANQMVQAGVTAFAGLALPFVLARLLVPAAAVGLPAAVVAGWFLLASPGLLHENQYIVCCYPLGLFLGACGLLAIERSDGWRWRLPLAVGLMALAHWVYVAAVIVLLPLAVGRAWVSGGWLRPLRGWPLWAGTGATLAGFGVGLVLMKTCHNIPPGDEPTPTDLLPADEWWASATAFGEQLADLPGFTGWAGGLAALAAVGVVLGFLRRGRPAGAWLAVGLFVLAGVCEVGFVATRSWTAMNQHHPRYLLGTLSLLQAAAAVLLAVRVPDRPRLAAVACGLLLAVVVGRYGLPSVGRVRAIVDDKFGEYTADVMAADCPGLAGDYWTLWPTLWHLDLVRYERGEPLGAFPVGTKRTTPWPAVDGPFRVAVPKGQLSDAAEWVARRGLDPLVRVGEYNKLDIYTTRPRPADR